MSRGWDDITGTVNVTYLGDESPLNLTEVWRTNNPKSSSRPFCVVTRLCKYIGLFGMFYETTPFTFSHIQN